MAVIENISIIESNTKKIKFDDYRFHNYYYTKIYIKLSPETQTEKIYLDNRYIIILIDQKFL